MKSLDENFMLIAYLVDTLSAWLIVMFITFFLFHVNIKKTNKTWHYQESGIHRDGGRRMTVKLIDTPITLLLYQTLLLKPPVSEFNNF